jgi:hypothetical protein
MKKQIIICLAVCFFAATVAEVAAQQPANVAGTWDVTLYKQGPGGKADARSTQHEWVLRQEGAKITGTAKIDKQEFPIQGTITGKTIRAKIEQNQGRSIFVTVDGPVLYGSVASTLAKCEPHQGVSIRDAGACSLDEPANVEFAKGSKRVK